MVRHRGNPFNKGDVACDKGIAATLVGEPRRNTTLRQQFLNKTARLFVRLLLFKQISLTICLSVLVG